ncbi:MAG: TlyA family rRNA (cytidine-2'-O)-methyltransferase [Thermodesulfobacteriota bacterium]|nr:MAG: TlyA family rRNA (cytidine-2'-O)-methyltransferase [Thermodesulfobacteriota bacterium]
MIERGKRPRKIRIDELLTERGLAETRSRARALVMSGNVLVGGARVDKAGKTVDPDAEITIKQGLPYVSRGGVKLAGFLDASEMDVKGLTALDVGSSTGGFTDCLLKRGVKRVYCVDVGKGIIDWKLRGDERVRLLEGRNIRHLAPEEIGEKVDMAVIDVSFISLEKVLPQVKGFLKEGARVLALVKPQFEAGRKDVGKGGIVRDPEIQRRAVERVVNCSKGLGYTFISSLESPITGRGGNREFWVCLKA